MRALVKSYEGEFLSDKYLGRKPERHITIIFYANDTVGNIGFNEVVIIKEITISEPSNLFSNPLFYIFTIPSIVLGITILYLSKKKSEKK